MATKRTAAKKATATKEKGGARAELVKRLRADATAAKPPGHFKVYLERVAAEVEALPSTGGGASQASTPDGASTAALFAALRARCTGRASRLLALAEHTVNPFTEPRPRGDAGSTSTGDTGDTI